jgi:O-antigen ligase
LLAAYKIIIQLKFIPLPVFFFILGLVTYGLNKKKSLYLFLFLLPIVNALPDFFFNGYPFNYMGIALFYLAGILISARFFKRGFTNLQGAGTKSEAKLEEENAFAFNFKWAGPYFLFLVILWISALFVLLRWSNITLPSLAFWKDTAVTPSGELVSFASIFPVVTLFLFSLAPYILVLIKNNRLEEAKVFKALIFGYTVSFSIGLFQKIFDPDFMAIRWWGEKLNQYNGGFSDFNAFGFFSGALFFYLVMAMVNRLTEPGFKFTGNYLLNREFLFNAAGLSITLIGVFLSGCRTAFLFVLFVIGFLFFTRKIKLYYKLISLLLIILLLIAAGGTLKKRMVAMADNAKKIGGSSNILTALDKVSNGRIEMMQRSIPILKKYPLTGVGSGNFLFFLKYRYLGEQYWEDLPLNQYLLILDETGLTGLFVFVCFLFFLLKQKRKKIYSLLLFSMLIAIFFNFFFWFPEVLLLFWIISSFAEEKAAVGNRIGRKKKVFFAAAILLLFVSFNIFHFDSLHPKTWVKEKDKEYGYGFWHLEKTPDDEVYRWTKAEFGVYLYLDKNGESKPFKLFCGAPLAKLEGKEQKVQVFWRGKLYKTITFKENKEFIFTVKNKPFAQGFLEFRVSPAFNLKKLNLSPESRDLGVQFYTLF